MSIVTNAIDISQNFTFSSKILSNENNLLGMIDFSMSTSKSDTARIAGKSFLTLFLALFSICSREVPPSDRLSSAK